VLRALPTCVATSGVTDANPETSFRRWKNTGATLTALARQGKIDPVIGRDEEIRRVMQWC